LTKYVIKRLGYAVLTLLIVATVTFFLMRSIPGDPLSHMTRGLPEQTRENYYAKYGLDQPLFTQYLMYMKNLLQGDFGESPWSFSYRYN
jgi:oligopeptide transport system permease protein